MEQEIKEFVINNVCYVPKESVVPKEAEKLNGLDYVIVRAYSSGVHAGYLKEENGDQVILLNARRIWYWDGAASISQLAMEGTIKPENCKFPCEVNKISIKGVSEVIPCTEKARLSIKNVLIWKK